MKDFILAVENVPKPMLIAEAVLIVLIIGVVAIRFFIIRSKPAYLKKLPKATYDEETIHLLFNCYKAADSIEGMLHLAVKKSRNRKNKKRFKACIRAGIRITKRHYINMPETVRNRQNVYLQTSLKKKQQRNVCCL